jgi:hypothetical protein
MQIKILVGSTVPLVPAERTISQNSCAYRGRASPTKCGRNIVVACWANDRTEQGGGKRRGEGMANFASAFASELLSTGQD